MSRDVSIVPDSFKNWQPLLDAIVFPVCLVNQDHAILQCNQAFAAFVGLPTEEVMGAHCSELVHHCDGADEHCVVRKSIREKNRAQTTGRIGAGFFQITADPLFDEQGLFVCAIHTFHDISEQKASEEEARRSADLYQSIFNGIRDGISVLDTESNIVLVNEAVRQMVMDGEHVQGKKCYQAYHQSQQPCDKCPARRAIKSGEIETEEVTVINREKETRTMELRVFPIQNEAGNVVNLVEYVSDITEKKKSLAVQAEQAILLKVGADIGQVLTRAESVSMMLQECAEVINRSLGGAFTRIWLFNELDKMLELQASAGIYTQIDGGHRLIPLGQYKIGKIAADRVPHMTNEVIGDPMVQDQEWAKKEGMVAFLGYPILIKDRLVGVLALFSRNRLSKMALQVAASAVDEIALGVERFKQEEALEKSEEHYRRLVENLKERYFFYRHDTTGRFTYVSPSVSNILGYSTEQMQRHYSSYLTDNPKNEKVKLFTEAAIRGEVMPPYEVEMRHLDGSFVDLEIMESPVFLGDKVVAVEGVACDVTEKYNNFKALFRKNRALAALSQCREVLRSSVSEKLYLEAICQVVVDTGGYHLAWVGVAKHDEGKSIAPLAQQGYEGGYLEEINISWGDNEKGRGPTGTAIREAKTVVCKNIQTDPNFALWRVSAEKYGYNSSLAIPLFVNKQIKGALSIYSKDVDAFDREEIQLLEELAADVSVGIKTFQDNEARKKAEKQLRQAEKMDAIGTLAGGIAHDFNNILSPIIGFTQLVMENMPENSVDRKDLQIVYESAVRAKNLVKQILTFSRQDEGEMLPCMIIPLLKEAIKFLRSSFPATIEIKQDFRAKETVLVNGNATMIHQIIMNLCTNSLHAMEIGGGTLSITLLERSSEEIVHNFVPEAQAYVELVVADSGAGMDKETLARIFEPYFSTKKQGQGTGLGLSIVYGIIEKLQGQIFFESREGTGTTAHVFLPVTDEKEYQKMLEGEDVPRGTETILIVDDEDFVCRAMGRILTGLGYNVISTTSSLEALELFQKEKEHIGLVLTDQTMPKMTGTQLAARVHEAKVSVPVVIMTGYSVSLDERKAYELGIKALLAKPVPRKTLAHVIRRLLDGDDLSGLEVGIHTD